MNSNSMAKLHYSGKNHEKKVRLYMNNLNGGEAGSSAPKKAKLEPKSTPPKPMLITANLQLDESNTAEKEKPMVVNSSAVSYCQIIRNFNENVSRVDHWEPKDGMPKLQRVFHISCASVPAFYEQKSRQKTEGSRPQEC